MASNACYGRTALGTKEALPARENKNDMMRIEKNQKKRTKEQRREKGPFGKSQPYSQRCASLSFSIRAARASSLSSPSYL